MLIYLVWKNVSRLVENEMAGLETRISFESMVIKPPSHPTYDLTTIIKLALSEDLGDQGLIPFLSSMVILSVI